jgi:ATP-dependent protease ClpP protease subunit
MPGSTALGGPRCQVPDADYTPNRDRAIWIEGQLNDAMLERLRPQILVLTSQSRKPITVFVDSKGGSCEVGEGILRLLRRTTAEDTRVSRIITIAAPKAHSAAANLLSAGDFAIAYPGSTLVYHGARFPLSEPVLDGESGKRLSQTLPTLHEKDAAALARSSVQRFLFIVSACRSLFAQRRADKGDMTLTDMDCFHAILREKLSPAAQNVLDLAISFCACQNGLLLHFQKKLRRGRTVTEAQLQKLMLYTGMSFEFDNADNLAWEEKLSRISDHFYFLNAYFDFGRLCDWIAAREPHTADDEEAEAAYFQPFRFFFLALCRALQEGENYVTAMDAVWLGLVDSVREDAIDFPASS